MKIAGIKEVYNRKNGKDILVKVDFDPDITNRWELTDPVVSVSYSKDNDRDIGYMELLDLGINVHGFEFSGEEENKILDFLRKEKVI